MYAYFQLDYLFYLMQIIKKNTVTSEKSSKELRNLHEI